MTKEITVVEIIHAAPGKEKELKKALEELVISSLAEEGMLRYNLLSHAEDRSSFLVLMKLRSMHDLKIHEESKHIHDFVEKYDGILYDKVEQTEWYG